MRIFIIILYLVLLGFGVSFAILNATAVPIHLYVVTYTLPVALLVALTLGFGIFLGFFLGVLRYWRLKITCRRLEHQLKMAETK